MTRSIWKSLVVIVTPAVGAILLAGCASRTAPNAPVSQAPATPSPVAQIQARQQAILNNPRLSPAMKAMIRKKMQHAPPGTAP